VFNAAGGFNAVRTYPTPSLLLLGETLTGQIIGQPRVYSERLRLQVSEVDSIKLVKVFHLMLLVEEEK
jgi:hypothetical protein